MHPLSLGGEGQGEGSQGTSGEVRGMGLGGKLRSSRYAP